MVRVMRLPPELDEAELRNYSIEPGQPVKIGDAVAAFTADGHVRVMQSTLEGTLLQHLMVADSSYDHGEPVALIGNPDETVGWDPSKIGCVRMALLKTCSECGADFPVNGLLEEFRCIRCGDMQVVSRHYWKQEFLENVESARNQPGSSWGFVSLSECRFRCRSVVPTCPSCHTLIDFGGLTLAWSRTKDGARTTIPCTGCGVHLAARQPPAWGREAFPGLLFLLGEVTAEATEGRKPVIFKCPSCLASLEIEGQKRIVRCKFCESDVYLPDDLWLHFNPAAKRARWWMLFEPS